MENVNKLWMLEYIFPLSEGNYSYSVIQKRCKRQGIKISMKFKLVILLEIKEKICKQNCYQEKNNSKQVSQYEERTIENISMVKSFNSKRESSN